MSNVLSRAIFIFAALFVLTFAYALPALAQVSTGIELKPAIIDSDEDIQPGAQLQYEIAVKNISDSPQTYYLFVRDIIGTAANNAPIFADEGLEPTGFEVSQWITLANQELPVEPGATAVISFSVAVPQNASPGSHFGGIFVSLEPPRLRASGATIGYDVGSIIHLRIAGDTVDAGSIRSFATGNYVYGSLASIDFNARIENSGNTLLRPFGPLEVYNMFGKRVATITFNESQSGVLPKETRDFTQTWSGEGTGFGRYKANISLIYGPPGKQQTMSNSLSFWVLPMNIILPAAGILAVLLLIVYVSIKLYVRKQLSMAGMSSRRVASRRQRGPSSSAFLLVFVSMLTVTALFLILLLVLFA